MSYIVFVILHVLLPIFIPVFAGYYFHKRFTLNVDTLTKIQFYIMIPAFLFMNMYTIKLEANLFIQVVSVLIMAFVIMFFIGLILARVLGYNKNHKSALINASCFYNSGNFCIPLIALLFNNPFASAIQIIIMFMQNILLNIFGIFNTNIGHKSVREAFLDIFKLPMMYAIFLGFGLQVLDISIYQPIQDGLNLTGEGLVPVALITLGAQLADTQLKFRSMRVYLAGALRLIIAPVITGTLLWGIGLEGIPAQVLLICSGAPTAINTVLLAIEFKNEPEYASQTVFFSTACSALTIPVVIYFAQLLF